MPKQTPNDDARVIEEKDRLIASMSRDATRLHKRIDELQAKDSEMSSEAARMREIFAQADRTAGMTREAHAVKVPQQYRRIADLERTVAEYLATIDRLVTWLIESAAERRIPEADEPQHQGSAGAAEDRDHGRVQIAGRRYVKPDFPRTHYEAQCPVTG